MNKPINVYVFGGEGTGWALDADVQTTRQSLAQLPHHVRMTPLEKAEVVHSVWEYPLLHMDPEQLHGKRIICHICNDPMRTFEDPAMTAIGERLGLWIAISTTALREIKQLGFQASYVPYTVDTSVFTEQFPKSSRKDLKRKYGLPLDKLVISSFMRDSSASDLTRPKEQKGVEAFLAIVVALHSKKLPIHILLAGPRRHWLRGKLFEHGVPFTYIGQEIASDDNKINILSPSQINELYHASDLHLVTSRWEGGPRAVLETAATRTPILCTPVGMAPDILEAECLIRSIDEAITKVEQFYDKGRTNYPLQAHWDRIAQNHTPAANIFKFQELYEKIYTIPRFDQKKITWSPNFRPRGLTQRIFGKNIVERFFVLKKTKPINLVLWHDFDRNTDGDDATFLLALKKEMEIQDARVAFNQTAPMVDVHICNLPGYNAKLMERFLSMTPQRIIQRIAIPRRREIDNEDDDAVYTFNRRLAAATIFPSAYAYQATCASGYRPASPVIIHNAANPAVYARRVHKEPILPPKKRLLATSWTEYDKNALNFFRWLDTHLDFNHFSCTIASPIKGNYQHIEGILLTDPAQHADLLHEADIYIYPHTRDSNCHTLIQALSCGLPTLYHNSGSGPELVGFGGLPFNGENDFLNQLRRLEYSSQWFGQAVYVKSMGEIAGKYIALARRVIECYHHRL